MAKLDPRIIDHLEWIGFVRPTGLVVSAPALVRAGAILDRRDAVGQRLLRESVVEEPKPSIRDFRTFANKVLGWSFSPRGYAGTDESPIPPELEVATDGDTLRPDFAVRELDPQGGRLPWQLLVRLIDSGEDFDRVSRKGQLEASEHGRMERLLRQTGVEAGLLFNGEAIRLLSAPYGETSGWLDFKVADMIQTAGRPIATAMRLLLNEQRLLSLPRAQRLAGLLDDSRKFQNEVSERLAEQVLHALYELLRGFQRANERSEGSLLRYTLADHPDEVYRGLLTVLLRLVFLLYAEERDMLPEDETFLRNYSLGGLYEKLREDAALYPDTMDDREGAWGQLLSLFRIIHDGAEVGTMRLPKRHGVLFDPDSYPFLEGRFGGARQIHERIDPPAVPDGTIYRALEKLLVLDGERISYRALDVEQIGSVYETMMGFRLERTSGPSVGIKAQKKKGAPTAIDLNELLGKPQEKRDKWIAERADRKLAENVKRALKQATTIDDLHAALAPVIDRHATPDIVPMGAMVLQPSEERRRSGSHYTPRSLTEPIVRTTLEPILKRLRGADSHPPSPDQILDLKVCDPAMGSGAFLVEACRQLGDALVESWRAHNAMPQIPSDEGEVIFARRLVAQRCLYGVDKNPVAVDLAKVSLWLITLAREHPLTFVDHALRHGDSLVGLSPRQFAAFHWDESAPAFQQGFETMRVREHLKKVTALRHEILEAPEGVPDRKLRELWHEAESELNSVRLLADLVMAAFFEGKTSKEREAHRSSYAQDVIDGLAQRHLDRLREWRNCQRPLVPFHWEIEFPEVFDRMNPGFDAIVGNPPFLGGTKISTALGSEFLIYLNEAYPGSGNRMDLVGYFFRRAFTFLRDAGCFGLIGSNTIAQGDTRTGGLSIICANGGAIYSAVPRVRWPGQAAVVVSVVHIHRGPWMGSAILNAVTVHRISAFLVAGTIDDTPARLDENARSSFEGFMIAGQGFLFDDEDPDASSIAEMHRLINEDRRNADVIAPYLGGKELNTHPQHLPHRFAINFGSMSESEAKQWPGLYAIVSEKVKPERETANRESRRKRWWQYGETRPGLVAATEGLARVLVCSQTGAYISFAFVPTNIIWSTKLKVFPHDTFSFFAVMQSRVHDMWARFFGSTMKDDPVYVPTDCFETFPFPNNWKANPHLEVAGELYYLFRSDLMVQNSEGLTKTYNRFHDPEEHNPDILRLRELHAAMDRAVLDAYGWGDIGTDCEFLLDYEIDDEDWGDKKRPYRYRWHDAIHDEVLSRLLELNVQRAAGQVRSGGSRKSGPIRKPTPNNTRGTSGTRDLF